MFSWEKIFLAKKENIFFRQKCFFFTISYCKITLLYDMNITYKILKVIFWNTQKTKKIKFLLEKYFFFWKKKKLFKSLDLNLNYNSFCHIPIRIRFFDKNMVKKIREHFYWVYFFYRWGSLYLFWWNFCCCFNYKIPVPCRISCPCKGH